MQLPQPSPDTPDIPWFSFSDGILELGWLTTLILVALLAVGLTALWRVIGSLLHKQGRDDVTVQRPQRPLRR